MPSDAAFRMIELFDHNKTAYEAALELLERRTVPV